MSSLDFSALHLVIGDESPSLEKLNAIFTGEDDRYSSQGTHYIIQTKKIDNDLFWLYAKYGAESPYSEVVLNVSNSQQEKNPRKINQVETDKQIFCIYSMKRNSLYSSTQKKKSFLEEYFKSKTSSDVFVKFFYKDPEEFLNYIKKVNKIKFVTKSNLFTADGELYKIFPEPNDLFGLGMPDDFTLEANFTNARVTPLFNKFFKKMVRWKNSCQAESLLCIGQDDKNFEAIFNVENFINRLTVNASKDSKGMYEPSIVMNSIVSKIRGGKDEENSQ
jgi:hypothetical protein